MIISLWKTNGMIMIRCSLSNRFFTLKLIDLYSFYKHGLLSLGQYSKTIFYFHETQTTRWITQPNFFLPTLTYQNLHSSLRANAMKIATSISLKLIDLMKQLPQMLKVRCVALFMIPLFKALLRCVVDF